MKDMSAFDIEAAMEMVAGTGAAWASRIKD